MQGGEINHYQAAIAIHSRRLMLVGKSICIGVAAGIVVVLYRLLLMGAEELSLNIYAFFSDHLALLPILFLSLGALGYLIGSLAQKYRAIGGSGIPQVKGIISGQYHALWLSTLIAKFFGGAASILAGLSLGREGPSIQLGACVAQGIGDKIASSRTEKRILIAGGASAGLAAAFNAPLAGAMFAMEEIFKYISPLVLLVTMVSAVTADFVSKLVFGMAPVFSFRTAMAIPFDFYWLLLLMGLVLGAAGSLYNLVLVKTIALYKKPRWLRASWRPMLPFLAAGVLALVFPAALGSGHAVVEKLNPSTGVYTLLAIFAVKFLFSMISFGSGAPGGIFFPLLILGATIGAITGNIASAWLHVDPALFNNFVIVAMAGYFSAIVRAPITGVVLLLEMTGSFVNLLPLLVVSLVAYVVADLLKSKPIYDSLLENLVGGKPHAINKESSGKITAEFIVHYDSPAAGQTVKDLHFPKECLLIAVRREGKDIIPAGDTVIYADDYLVFLFNIGNEAEYRELLTHLTTAS
jgi:H+/Cl- antiporter ClcA